MTPTIEISFQSPSGLRDLPIKCCPSSSSLWGLIENLQLIWHHPTDLRSFCWNMWHTWICPSHCIGPQVTVGEKTASSHLFTQSEVTEPYQEYYSGGVFFSGVNICRGWVGNKNFAWPTWGMETFVAGHRGPCGDPSSEDYKYNTYDWEGCMDDHYSSLFLSSIQPIYSASCLKIESLWNDMSFQARVPKAALFLIKHWTQKSDKLKVPGALSQKDPMNPCNKQTLECQDCCSCHLRAPDCQCDMFLWTKLFSMFCVHFRYP